MKHKHFAIKGDLDRAAPYYNLAKQKNQLRETLQKLSLWKEDNPFWDETLNFDAGIFIRDKQLLNENYVEIMVPPLPEAVSFGHQEELLYPPATQVCESFYLVYDVVVPSTAYTVEYTGEHLTGYYVSPYHDGEFDARYGSTYWARDTLVASPTDPNAPLTTGLERDFLWEPEHKRNYDAFTEPATVFRTLLQYGYLTQDGIFGLYGSHDKADWTKHLCINGKIFKTFNWTIKTAGGGASWPYDAHVHILGYPTPAYGSGTIAYFEGGTVRYPQDEQDGEPSTSTGELFKGGAYDDETEDFICMWYQRTVSTDAEHDHYYLALGKSASSEHEELVYQESGENYSSSLQVLDAKIYQILGRTVWLISFRLWDGAADNYWIVYYVFVRENDGTITKFERIINMGSSLQAFYWHNIADERGNDWPCRGNFRIVKDTTEYIYPGGKTYNMAAKRAFFIEYHNSKKVV